MNENIFIDFSHNLTRQKRSPNEVDKEEAYYWEDR
jgi:hypothetical protein